MMPADCTCDPLNILLCSFSARHLFLLLDGANPRHSFPNRDLGLESQGPTN